jgi:hypothetical protein
LVANHLAKGRLRGQALPYDGVLPQRLEGAHVERVNAADCDTPEAARACAQRLVEVVRKLRANQWLRRVHQRPRQAANLIGRELRHSRRQRHAARRTQLEGPSPRRATCDPVQLFRVTRGARGIG